MTGIDLTWYRTRSRKIMGALERIQEAAKQLGVESAGHTLESTKRELADEVFKLVVVGEFSRGKSTFVNGLLGRRLLPSSPSPTTTVLSKLKFAAEPYYCLHYRDGRPSEKITEEQFQNIVAPVEPDTDDSGAVLERERRMEQLGEIAHAEIGYPTAICQGGVELIDTPGTNDLDAAREEITYNFIPSADAAIIVLSGRQQLTETEMSFLKDRLLKADIQKLFFVVNFKDVLKTEASQRKVMDYIQEHLAPITKNAKVFLLSAKQALAARRHALGEAVKGEIVPMEQTGYLEFEAALGAFLSEERGGAKLAKPLERAMRIADELKRNAIRLPLSTIGMNLIELETRTAKVQEELNRVSRAAMETVQRLRTALTSGGLQLRSQWESGLHQVATTAVQAVSFYTGPLQKEELARTIEAAVAPVQTKLQERIRTEQHALLEEEVNRANRRLEQEWEAIDRTIVKSLLPRTGDESGQDEEYSVYYDEDEVIVKTGLGSLGLLGVVIGLHVALPLAIPALFFGGKFLYSYFDGKVRERALAEIRVQVERRYRDVIPGMCTDFDRQWSRMVDDTIGHFETEIRRKLGSIEQQLQRVLAERNSEASQIEQRKLFLHRLEKQLNDIIAGLAPLAEELTGRQRAHTLGGGTQ
ncbi:dynamin family protein [Paenibacillus sp. GD4]|uniref:dynamin family protein n=1 Tax=Paenibacillus sp. GD4 TaxID=3068890 RepID=UPI0027967A91|nr:dynamin family protein [Paenibacillus sp. GD4]MDQ1909061.1 dynamin family protein [Paenibacillus sp. GD4]